MGIAWCRERVEQAQNSKNPVDRILIRCSNAIKPKTTYSRSQDKIADDIVYKGMRSKNLISPPVPVHAAPPRHRNREKVEWQTCALNVPEGKDANAPIPPPRKKRKRRINSLQAINTQLQLIRQPGFSNYTENILNHEYITQQQQQNHNGKSKDISHPFTDRNYDKEKPKTANEQKRQSRYIKSSESRMSGKIKTESTHPNPLSNDVKDEKVKNDNRKKTEQKIKVVKNVSTVSLPNYNELVKPVGKVSSDVENSDDKTGNQSGGLKPPRRNSSAISLPGEGSNSIITSLSEATIHRLETYMKRCRSFGSLKPQQLIEKLEEFKKSNRSASESSDSWSGLDDWDLGVIEYCEPETTSIPPLLPKSTLPPKQPERKVGKQETVPLFSIGSTEISRSQTPPEVDENSKMLPDEKEEDPQVNIPNDLPLPVDNVPEGWLQNGTEIDEILEEVKTPPPMPENKQSEVDAESKGSTKDEVEKSEISELDPVPVPPRRKSREDPVVRKRKRSHSLNPEKLQNLLNLDVYKSRSPNVTLQRATSLIEELAKNPEEIEKTLRSDPKKVIDGLEKQCLYQSLPEDAFEIFLARKKPSLRESLSEFLGFELEKPEKSKDIPEEPKKSEGVVIESVMDEIELERKTPPPLPSSPPPMLETPVELEVVLTSPNPLVKHSDQNPDNM